jgi:acyl-CoA thioester hydrolase
MGFAHHSNYLVWCEAGRVELMRALGTSYREVERDGAMLAVTAASLEFLAPARFDDLVRVETRVTAVGSRKVCFAYLLTNAESGERLAKAQTTLLCIDGTGKVTRLPQTLLETLERALTAEDDSA